MGRMARLGGAFVSLLVLAAPSVTADSMEAELQPFQPLEATAGLTAFANQSEFVDFFAEPGRSRFVVDADTVRFLVFERRWQAPAVGGEFATITGLSTIQDLNLTGAHITITHPGASTMSSVGGIYRGLVQSAPADCKIEPRTLRQSGPDSRYADIPGQIQAVPGLPQLWPSTVNYLTATCESAQSIGRVEGSLFPHEARVDVEFERDEQGLPGSLSFWSGLEARPNQTLPYMTDFVRRQIHVVTVHYASLPMDVVAHDYHKVRVRSPLFAVAGTIQIPPGLGRVDWGSVRVDNLTQPLAATGEFRMSSPGESTISISGHTFDGPSFASVAPRTSFAAIPVLVAAAGGLVGLWFVLRHFGWLGLFSRLSQTSALEHQTRQQILQAVQLQPGLSVSRLVTALGMVRRTVVHHLGVLRDHRLVEVRRFRGRTAVYPRGALPAADHAALAALQLPIARRILSILAERPTASQGEIAALAGVTQGHISREMRRLRDHGILRSAAPRQHTIDLSPHVRTHLATLEA